MAGSFVYSLVCGLVSARKHTKKNISPDDKKRKRRSNWFSHADRIRLNEHVTSDKSLLIDNVSSDDSGYKSPAFDLSSTSASVDDICDIYCLDDSLDKHLNEDGDMLRKASSLSSLLRCTSIQDKSLRLTRRRRQNMAKRKSRILSADEGIDLAPISACDDITSINDVTGTDDVTSIDNVTSTDNVTSADDIISSDEGSPKVPHQMVELLVSKESLVDVTDIQISNDVISRTHQVGVIRNSSMQMKSWEIRRRRKQMLRKRRSRSCDELGTIAYELSYGSVGDLRSVDSKASRQMKVRSFYI